LIVIDFLARVKKAMTSSVYLKLPVLVYRAELRGLNRSLLFLVSMNDSSEFREYIDYIIFKEEEKEEEEKGRTFVQFVHD